MKIEEIKFEEIEKALKNIVKQIGELPEVSIEKFDLEKSVIIVVDMIKGFAKIGSLYSKNCEENIDEVKVILEKTVDYKKIFIADTHKENSTEFKAYPKHCIEGTEESEIVDELKHFVDSNSVIIKKNTTNAIFTDGFKNWIKENDEVKNFIIIGVCTDICVSQFSIGLKAYFNQINKEVKVIVPVKAVNTYDLSLTSHCADLMNVVSLYNMQNNGVELVKTFK